MIATETLNGGSLDAVVRQRTFMKDREYLMWLHERLEHVHGESHLVDYMHKLRAIIRSTPEKRETPNCNSCNSLEELQRELSNDQAHRSAPGVTVERKGNDGNSK